MYFPVVEQMVENQRAGRAQYHLGEIRAVIDRLFEGLRTNEAIRSTCVSQRTQYHTEEF